VRSALLVVAACASALGCIYLTGVQSFEKGSCEGPCVDAAPEADVATDCPSGMVRVAGGA
jgi:hypothetical protein